MGENNIFIVSPKTLHNVMKIKRENAAGISQGFGSKNDIGIMNNLCVKQSLGLHQSFIY